ncbi:hypothetical protein CkaCkLH20_05825 [Colletotrichum karsti]|uniref:Uncharacterized protein n=1 Tax=Colletotrichum karsti TaxID=1095194 RepID=A0A9P6I671_9PEZI|nr:uncharacterized protein CkaCkLH20_05825 [Colletotrichum karsti]KAF9876979.1 hypothetical protein CkaCkLH20_05825 [Colletotrichum karsti]
MSHISTPLPHPFPAALPPKAARRLMEPPKSGWPDAPRKNLPAWNRVVDVVYHKFCRGKRPDDDDFAFDQSVALYFANRGRLQDSDSASPYFGLPTIARFKICQELAMSHSADLPITLTASRSTREVWKDDEFINLASAVKPLESYLSVSFAFRAEMMVAFLMTERFHVTFSPFVNTYFDPLATLWCNRYGPFMQQIVLELDMTRLGFGPGKKAYKLRAGTINLDTQIKMFVESQLKRSCSLKSLVLLCRRFYGQRPQVIAPLGATESNPDDLVEVYEPEGSLAMQKADDGVYYCPDEALHVCEPLTRLEWMIDSMRLVGFSNQYTHFLIRRIFPVHHDANSLKHHSYRVAPSCVWPRLPGQSSWIDTGRGRIQLDDHSREYLRGLYSPEGAIQLPPPYYDPETKRTSIRPPIGDMVDATEASELYERPETRMTMAEQRPRASMASDAESLERKMQGLVYKLRRSMSRRGTESRPLLDRQVTNRTSIEKLSFEARSAYSDGHGRSSAGTFDSEEQASVNLECNLKQPAHRRATSMASRIRTY